MALLPILLTVCVVGLSFAAEPGTTSFHWGYHGLSRPEFWGGHFPECTARRQSPIDIPHDVTYDTNLGRFTFMGYETLQQSSLTLLNNGHTVQVAISNPGGANISGGGLTDTYIMAQLHYHWGSDDSQGSEHTFRGWKFPLELHIVHYKRSYGSLVNSVDKSDGLAVLGFWFQIGEHNSALDTLITGLADVKNKDDREILSMTSFMPLMPSETDAFYRYMGSLTTPGCNEAVVWTVFENKGHLSGDQMKAFRSLYENKREQTPVPMVDNFRPIQNLYSRPVSRNFDQVSDVFHWGYAGHEAPKYWKAYYKTCTGDEQSPINIVDDDAELDTSLGTLLPHNYTNNMTMTLRNNGHTVQIDVTSDHFLSDGGLNGKYRVLQAHFHWGDGSGMAGSEHTRNGESSPLEMHIVHTKEEYTTVSNAVTYRDGLAVLGTFFTITKDDNPKLAPLISKLPDVKYKGANVAISGFSLADLTYDDLDVHPFFRYNGGLTTPPCSQVVIWTVLMGKVRISEAQLAEFRKVFEGTEGDAQSHPIVNNYRPVQSLNSRVVKTSINVLKETSSANIGCSGSLQLVLLISSIVSVFYH